MPTEDMATTLQMEAYYQLIMFQSELIDRPQARLVFFELASRVPEMFALGIVLHTETP